MPIWQYAMRAPMPSFLPHTTTPKLAAYIYTPARVPAGPRCPAAHGLAHRSGVPFFFASERRACSGSIVHAEGRANRAGEAGHVLVNTSAAPLGRRRCRGCMRTWSSQHVRSFSNMASRPHHRQFTGRPACTTASQRVEPWRAGKK